MSAGALLNAPRADRNGELRQRIVSISRPNARSGVTRVMDRLALTRGLPKMIRSDNGKEFCGKAMVIWTHERGVQLRLIEPSKPNQNAYIESFNGRLRDECLNEHWLPSLLHARPRSKTGAGNATRNCRIRRWAGWLPPPTPSS